MDEYIRREDAIKCIEGQIVGQMLTKKQTLSLAFMQKVDV